MRVLSYHVIPALFIKFFRKFLPPPPLLKISEISHPPVYFDPPPPAPIYLAPESTKKWCSGYMCPSSGNIPSRTPCKHQNPHWDLVSYNIIVSIDTVWALQAFQTKVYLWVSQKMFFNPLSTIAIRSIYPPFVRIPMYLEKKISKIFAVKKVGRWGVFMFSPFVVTMTMFQKYLRH